jgi:hypothetical protein
MLKVVTRIKQKNWFSHCCKNKFSKLTKIACENILKDKKIFAKSWGKFGDNVHQDCLFLMLITKNTKPNLKNMLIKGTLM